MGLPSDKYWRRFPPKMTPKAQTTANSKAGEANETMVVTKLTEGKVAYVNSVDCRGAMCQTENVATKFHLINC